MSAIDDYLKNTTPNQKAVLVRLSEIIKEIVPEVEEVISYGIPAFRYKKQYLIFFGAFRDHMSMFPASDEMVAEIGEELGKFRTSKGTFRFTEDNLIPEPIIRQAIIFRRNSIDKRTANTQLFIRNSSL